MIFNEISTIPEPSSRVYKHFSVITFGIGCICNHSHCIVAGYKAESKENFELVLRTLDGQEARCKLSYEEWLELYTIICPTDYHGEEQTRETVEKQLAILGCECQRR